MDKKKSHFVLVHGSAHGAWCWYKVLALLSNDGHRVTPIDLGASGINPKQLDDIPTFSGYLQPLTDFFAALPSDEKVILVGHSMGGVEISVAMEKFPNKVAIGVYVTSIMPDPKFNLLDLNQQYFTQLDVYMDSTFTYGLGTDKPPTSVIFGPKLLSSSLYELSPPENFYLALTLQRPYPIYRDEISLKEASLSEENYGSVDRAYIVSAGDIMLTDDEQRSMIQNYPPKIVKEISGSDHMVMFSKPNELTSYLEEIAAKY